MSIPIRKTDESVVYEDPWLRLRVDRIMRGAVDEPYGVVERADSVAVVPISPSRRTLLLRQYRHPTTAFSWEIPMGGIDKGESAENAAVRELQEESGIVSNRLEALGTFVPCPALSPQKCRVFVASVSESDLDAAVHAPRVDDITEIRVVGVDELYQMAVRGEITDGFTLSSMMLLRLWNET